jgi:hypothetical protein
MAGIIVLAVRTAREEAIRVFEHGGSAEQANATFLTLIDRGFTAVHEMAARSTAQPVNSTRRMQTSIAASMRGR